MIRVYEVENEKFSYDVQNLLHSIKYEGVYDSKVEQDCIYGVSNFENLSRKEQERLGRLAVYVAVSFHRRKERAPEWSVSKRIWLEPAYVHEHCTEHDILGAFQPSYDHNVFIPLSGFDVL